MTARDLARRALGEAAILAEAKVMADATRDELMAEMEAGDRYTVKSDDGTPLGMVYVTDPKPACRVTDRPEFLRWVQDNHPDAVVMVPTVVPAWEANLLRSGVDHNGEVPDGVETVVGKPTLAVRPSEDAKLLAQAFVTRELEP